MQLGFTDVVSLSGLQGVTCEAASTDLVDGISNGEKLDSFSATETPLFLQQGDDERSIVVHVSLVSVDHRHAVLRVRPECVCRTTAFEEKYHWSCVNKCSQVLTVHNTVNGTERNFFSP